MPYSWCPTCGGDHTKYVAEEQTIEGPVYHVECEDCGEVYQEDAGGTVLYVQGCGQRSRGQRQRGQASART